MNIIVRNFCCGRGLREALYIVRALQAKNIQCSYSISHEHDERLKHNAELTIYDKKYMQTDLNDKVLNNIIQDIQEKEKQDGNR